MQLYQNKCVNDLLPGLHNLNPSKNKKKLGTLFLYSRPDCFLTDLFNALQLGNVCTYSRTELKSQPNRGYSLWHSQSHENSPGVLLGLAFQKKKDNFKMNMNHNRHGRMILPSVTEKRIWRRDPADNPPASPGPADIDSASDSSPVVSLPSHPLLLAPAVRYARRRLGTSQTRHFNYVCPASVTECLVTGKNLAPLFQPIRRQTKTHLFLHRVLIGSFDCLRMLRFTFFTFDWCTGCLPFV